MNARPFFASIALVALGCSSGTTDTTGPSSPDLDAEESALLYEVDRLREANGVPGALIICKALNKSASLHSDDMRDKGYVAEKAPDGSAVRDRACDAGYEPSCGTAASVAEMVAGGIDKGAEVVEQWAANPDAKTVLLNDTLIAAGAGRAITDDGKATWTLDLGGADDPSCH